MAIDIDVRVVPGGFQLVNAGGEDAHSELPMGSVHRAKVYKPRNIKFHRKWFALLQVLYPHQDSWPTFDMFRRAVQRACNYCEVVNGQVFDVSIKFHKMDNKEFEGLFERTLVLAETRIIPGINRQDVLDRWNEVMAGYSDSKEAIEAVAEKAADENLKERRNYGKDQAPGRGKANRQITDSPENRQEQE